MNGCEYSAPGADRLYFEWRAVDQCALAEAMFVRMQFRVVDSSPRRTYRWHFDDGSEETGNNPRHFFAGAGPRQITVEALQNGAVMATNSVRLRVARNGNSAIGGATTFLIRPKAICCAAIWRRCRRAT